MKLETFKEKNTKKKAIIVGSVFVVLLISIVVFIRSFALFETKQEYNVIKGSVGNYSPSDITITSYMDGAPSKTFPNKDSEYRVDKVECSNGARGLWNYTNWEVNLSNLTTTGTKCKVYFVKSYKENILNGSDPVISENLIPVTIENDGTVKKADMTSEWYKYENKVWANAVILEDESKVYQNGEVIPESNIESYFVWIPRYKYKIFNEGNYTSVLNAPYQNNAREIEIIFENKNTPVSNGSTVGSFLSHPAFTSFNSNGMWVGKFETGYKGATTTQSAEADSFDVEKIQIKPNRYAWRSIRLSNMHLNSYNYQRDLDSHMMKNTEWGAVAYLSHSKYGIMNSIRINNSVRRITGHAARNEPTCSNFNDGIFNQECNEIDYDNTKSVSYNTPTGYIGSTTGNISGIYDMVGGSWEYVMGVMLDKNGNPVSGSSSAINTGFNGTFSNEAGELTSGLDYPDSKYYDKYSYTEDGINFNNRILGDATGEIGPLYPVIASGWYYDYMTLVNNASPIFIRGFGYYNGRESGIFSGCGHQGNPNSDVTYRIVLTP